MRRRQVSFWEGFRDYIVDEFKAIGTIIGFYMLILYLIVSLFVGMWVVLIYLIEILIWRNS
jgi:hypothetical protein